MFHETLTIIREGKHRDLALKSPVAWILRPVTGPSCTPWLQLPDTMFHNLMVLSLEPG